jgi:hypothetical protein
MENSVTESVPKDGQKVEISQKHAIMDIKKSRFENPQEAALLNVGKRSPNTAEITK